jgi:hypothetical protein
MKRNIATTRVYKSIEDVWTSQIEITRKTTPSRFKGMQLSMILTWKKAYAL